MPRRPVPPPPLPLDPSLTRQILLGDNLAVLPTLPRGVARLAYIDPPFNTGKRQAHTTVKAVQDDEGNAGFAGRRYRLAATREKRVYEDAFDDYLGFLMPRIEAALPCLTPDASLFVHLDYREAHYVKVALDQLLGRDAFMNEIIWAYDYGARAKKKWPAKHDTIFVYAKDASVNYFDSEGVDREPYMAPGLVTAEKVAKGKLPTDVWWHTIVPTNGSEKTGYPSQKPEGVVRRMVQASSRPGDWCLDFFCGSGTLGAVAASLGRHYVLIDSNPEAIEIARRRLGLAEEPPRVA